MKIDDEFRISNDSGNTLVLQKISKGISYLDFGMTHLGRDFEGYRVKYTDRTAQPQSDGTFKVSDSKERYHRI